MTPKFNGTLDSTFLAAEHEILHDLFAVIESVELKPVRITKSGIPPKPLWNAINHRLVWKDPQSVLYDWEEVDQVRFVYLLARELDLIRPDADGWLHRGGGAAQFFMASPPERARLLRRSDLNIWEWDERCDARNRDGHRHNFGKAYRRDFVHDVTELRLAALQLLEGVSRDWMPTREPALRLSEAIPDLLISEVGELPAVDEDGLDGEKLRFVNYWFTLLARFGWADMGRAEDADSDARLCRLTPLGAFMAHGKTLSEANRELGLAVDGRTLVPTEAARATDRYVAARLTGAAPGAKSFVADRDTVTSARDAGLDLALAKSWLETNVEGDVSSLVELVESAVVAKPDVRIARAAVALELDHADKRSVTALKKAGFTVENGLAIATGVDIPDLFDAVGGEPTEGFDYPIEDPLAAWKAGPSLRFHYEALPLQHRDLIEALGAEDCPPVIRFTPDVIAGLAAQGWGLESLCAALAELAQKSVPQQVRALFAEVLS